MPNSSNKLLASLSTDDFHLSLDDVCQALHIVSGNPAREVVAARIITLARNGQRSPTVLRDRLLREQGLERSAGDDKCEVSGPRTTPTAAYRFYTIQTDGRIAGPALTAEFAGDADAIEFARLQNSELPIEVWQSSRQVARIEHSVEPIL